MSKKALKNGYLRSHSHLFDRGSPTARGRPINVMVMEKALAPASTLSYIQKHTQKQSVTETLFYPP